MVRSDGSCRAPSRSCPAIPLRICLCRNRSNRPRRAHGHGFPSLSKEGSLLCRATETSLVEMGLALLPVLLYDGFFLIRTSPKTELVANYGNPGGFISVNKR